MGYRSHLIPRVHCDALLPIKASDQAYKLTFLIKYSSASNTSDSLFSERGQSTHFRHDYCFHSCVIPTW